MSDQNDNSPAPPTTAHADDRELGYGAVDARPDDGASGEVAGALNSGGQSAGNAYPSTAPATDGGKHDGQSEQGYSGTPNPNATSTGDD
ncbi:hypothetical protein KX816_00440 [Sphingosinicellaceae bacterium]|nr:hypothetical protein KX816_00440 [Sphingosinicellaceae bacterium]